VATVSGRSGARRVLRHQQPSDEAVAEVAWLYFVKNLTQGEIAARLGLSRPTVISYLRLAKERGIVRIAVADVHHRANALADALVERFGLATAHVVDGEGLAGAELTRVVAETAAHFLPEFARPGDEIGVSWGQTVSFVSEHVPHWPVPDLTVRQIIGSMANPLVPSCEACSLEIARRLTATCVNLHAPAVLSSADLAARLMEEPILKEQLANVRRCNKAVYSLSDCSPDTHLVKFGVTTREDIARYAAMGAAGIIAGRFVDEEGTPLLGELDRRIVGIDLASLRTMEGLLVVSGPAKTRASLAALRGGFANHVVADAALAEAILAAAP